MGIEIEDDDGFKGFLQQLINMGHLEGPAEGITKMVIEQGEKALSTKQEHVFKKHVIEPFFTEECKRCSCDIPWSEMYKAHDNGGYCNYCDYQMSKDD